MREKCTKNPTFLNNTTMISFLLYHVRAKLDFNEAFDTVLHTKITPIRIRFDIIIP